MQMVEREKGGRAMIKATVFPTTNTIRFKYATDKELDKILSALEKLSELDITVAKYGK